MRTRFLVSRIVDRRTSPAEFVRVDVEFEHPIWRDLRRRVSSIDLVQSVDPNSTETSTNNWKNRPRKLSSDFELEIVVGQWRQSTQKFLVSDLGGRAFAFVNEIDVRQSFVLFKIDFVVRETNLKTRTKKRLAAPTWPIDFVRTSFDWSKTNNGVRAPCRKKISEPMSLFFVRSNELDKARRKLVCNIFMALVLVSLRPNQANVSRVSSRSILIGRWSIDQSDRSAFVNWRRTVKNRSRENDLSVDERRNQKTRPTIDQRSSLENSSTTFEQRNRSRRTGRSKSVESSFESSWCFVRARSVSL